MENGACVTLYQPDYEKLKGIAQGNNVSIAEVISHLISEYERLMSGPQPQVIFQQMNNANQGGM